MINSIHVISLTKISVRDNANKQKTCEKFINIAVTTAGVCRRSIYYYIIVTLTRALDVLNKIFNF